MASLSAHLRQPGDHGGLGFHADCPVCREERLFGTLSSESVVSRRARAALATGALSVSLAAPPAVGAQESDSQQEGNVAPHEPGDGRAGDIPAEAEAPGFNSGGDTVLPFEVDPPQGAPRDDADDGEGESAPLETEPEVDPDVRHVPPIESEATPSPGDEAPVAPAPTPPPAADPTGAPEEPAGVQSDPGQSLTTTERPDRTGVTKKTDKPERQPAQVRERSTPYTDPPPWQTAEAAPQTSPRVDIAPAAQGHADAPAASPQVGGGSRFHVVRPGESLWSISKDLLGPDSSMARIAREVALLWELNEDRIATGDPDLLKIGTRLRLR